MSRTSTLPSLTPRPGARARRLRRPDRRAVVPFACVAALGLLNAAAPPYRADLSARIGELVGVVVLLPVLGVLFAEVLRRDRRSWVDLAAPGLCFVLVFLLSDLGGGAGAGPGPLVALPVVWLAVFGTWSDLVVGSVLAAATVLLPALLIGAPDYPAGEWRRAALWVGVAAVTGQVARVRSRETTAVAPAEPSGAAARPAPVGTLQDGLSAVTLTGLVTLDREGRTRTFGPGARQLWGYSAEQMAGRPFVELVRDPVEMTRLAAELGVMEGFPVLAELARRRSSSRAWVCLRGDGEPIVVRLELAELRDENGEVTGYLAVGVDDTGAVRAHEELARSEARWRVLMDHLPDAVVLLVEQGTGITVVTGGGVAGHRWRSSAGRWLQDVATESGVPIGKMLESAFAGEDQGTVDASVDGRDHEVAVSPLPWSGRPQALVLLRDVSRDRERERAVTAAKRRAERLFADAPQGIAVLTSQGQIVQVNPAMARLFGREDLVGNALSSLSFHAGDATVDRHLEAVLTAGAEHAAQWTVRGAGGAQTHVVLTSTVLPAEEGGQPDAVLTNVVDVSDRYSYEQQLVYLADHDPLTGLANRRRFDAELARHVDGCRRYGVHGALLVLDLDHFKEVNDSQGHAVGDELLVLVGEVLRGRLRSTDVVGRLGGDEFAVLLPHADRKVAELVAGQVVETLRERLSALGDSRSRVTVSVGGVVLDDAELTPSDLLSTADAAMYAAKAAGRDQYVLLG